ncbi:unnamed protein product [Rotaria socialis]|uniref:Uncharacterized protein n=1 Tax=Rotaria socialis TaxID=392032 RepID=A0A821K2U6_9BILA|nr:unnamed protein product [Rotaria socialis]CAF3368726.1 unnamed protein product [Rotaria socialis]CAF3469267.1 unnamed protein product [Rotaria socialis]CAF4227331.1 unnamed protein product [Rotaria socialis]CAF4325464.1 unnamed protein product [Rotaria socialis]
MSRAVPPLSRNSQAPGTSSGRPIGTATRLTTASGQRPSSRGGPLGSNMRIKVEDAPMVRGGLGGIQNPGGLGGRQVQDRTYFVGLVRSKVSDLESEIQRLRRESESFTEDNKQYFALSKAAEDLSQQIEILRNELGDYNMVIDRLQTTGEVAELKKEIADLTAHNHQVESSIDEIYLEKQRKEQRIQRLEGDLAAEKKKAERVLENMNPELKQRYTKIRSTSHHFQTQMDTMQNEITSLEGQMNKMREQMSGAVIKQEALSLVEQIYELEFKRDQLSNESKNILTPDQERQKLTQQVKEDNQEIAAMDKQISELRERNENLKQNYDNDDVQASLLVAQQSKSTAAAADDETKQKYLELKKRELHIDEFFSTYEETRDQYLNDVKNVQKSNLTLLALISRTLVKGDQGISRDDYTQLKTNVDQHEAEKKKSNDTLAILAEQHRKVKQDYAKVETLDQKLTEELKELKKQYAKMQEDLDKFNDLEGLKKKAEKRKIQLAADKSNMGKQRQVTKMEIQTLQSQFEAAQTQLRDNETHQQLVGLEKKLQSVSQACFLTDEALQSQNVQGQYEQIKRQALELVQAHNRWLIQNFQNSPIA